jgi:uncharacterized membrane protein YphA (DoxX/SURF4 family)
MKYLALISRLLVGIEFVFSGFVKVVDPYGTGLKLQEYFEVFAEDLPQFASFFNLLAENSLALSLVFCAAELVLGVALIFSFRMKNTAWVVLLFMLFFTFLTFYSAYFNKVTDCGCFGDFLKLNPWHSFYKDIISLLFILIIFGYRKKYNSSELGTPMVLISSILAFGIGIYGIRYLPIIDFLPYAAGKSIPEQMKKPDIKPIHKYVFLDKIKNVEIESDDYLSDTVKYKYISFEILNQDLLKPIITDFSLTDSDGNDATQMAFEGDKLMLIVKSKNGLEHLDFEPIITLANKANKRKIKVLFVNSLPIEDFQEVKIDKKISFDAYTCDEKVLKTMARTNPCLVLLKNGVVLKKWSINNIPSIDKINELVTNK